MRDDFAAFVLTHKRPDKQITTRTFRKAGYTGRLFYVVDDQDPTLGEYQKRYGDQVITFSKEEYAARYDDGDNFGDYRSILYARNATWDLAEQVGVRYFIQLDDDYTGLGHRMSPDDKMSARSVANADEILGAMVEFLESVPYLKTVAMAQGGDFIGGEAPRRALMRKAMNTFVCATDRRFVFRTRINEDVSTYTEQGRAGVLFLTYPRVYITQPQTQKNAGGLTEVYLDSGTYVKSFYTVMVAPSCTTINMMGGGREQRLHHSIRWDSAAPMILHENVRKSV
jgi:hypothetical protein